MKIVLVHNFYQQPGGEDAVFNAELNLLRKFGHNIILFTKHNKDLNKTNLFTLALNTIWSRQVHNELISVLAIERPDLVHFHNTFISISPAAYYACAKFNVPVVQTLHNYRLLCPRATLSRQNIICEKCNNKTTFWPAIQYACYRNSRLATLTVSIMLAFHHLMKTWHTKVDIYIALTEFSRQKFISRGLPANKIAIKPNFTNFDSNYDKHNEAQVLFVGRISSEKGIITLLEAWKQIRNIPLTIIGDGPLFSKLQTERANSVSKNIQ